MQNDWSNGWGDTDQRVSSGAFGDEKVAVADFPYLGLRSTDFNSD